MRVSFNINFIYISLFLGFLSLFSYVFFFGNFVLSAEDRRIDIGIIVPLDFEKYSYGETNLNILNLAFKEINDDGGIDGKIIKTHVFDGECSNYASAIAARDMIVKLDVDLIIGGICSDETIGAAFSSELAKKILITPTSSSDEITDLGDYVFRTMPSSTKTAHKLGEVVFERNNKHILIIRSNTSYAESEVRHFKMRFEELGGNIEHEVILNLDGVNMTHIVGDLEIFDVDSILIATQSDAEFRNLIEALKLANISLPIYSNVLVVVNDNYKFNLEYLSGTIYSTFEIPDGILKSEKLVKTYLELYGEDLLSKQPLIFSASTYDLPYVIKNVIEKCSSTNSNCMKAELYALDDFSGITGDITFDSNGDVDFEASAFIIAADGPKLYD
ncbi:MAG: ABC transporter substrate-binding protein [Nanoarchaeales archaeon]|nr:ABC transporter substrate-binding protein [Nanoarchaeales archaeon]